MKQQVKNKALQGIVNKTLEIQKNKTDKSVELSQCVEQAQESQRNARKAQETAKTEEDYFKACEAEKYHKQREAFWKKRLDEYAFTPRISEKEYNKQIQAAENNLEKAAEAYKAIVEKNMNEIIAAQVEYLKTAKETDEVLEDFDYAAKYLQSKYRYEEFPRQGMPPIRHENPHFWKTQKTRFYPETAHQMAIHKNGMPDKKLVAAWEAVAGFFRTCYGVVYPFETVDEVMYR